MDKEIEEAVEYWNLLNKTIHLKHHKTARKYDLTLEQFHLLIELDDLELMGLNNDSSPTVGDMAAKIGNAPHTLSERIKRLEKKGFVDKIKDKDDLRISRVKLTVKGQKLVKNIRTESRDNFFYSALEKMDKKSLDCLVECFKEILHELSR
ncbi:MAG: MarR family transcriptional regulator [Methanobacterium paludis]|nr:MarR family transcriptional regulator [Methanobacterium paludis]